MPMLLLDGGPVQISLFVFHIHGSLFKNSHLPSDLLPLLVTMTQQWETLLAHMMNHGQYKLVPGLWQKPLTPK